MKTPQAQWQKFFELAFQKRSDKLHLALKALHHTNYGQQFAGIEHISSYEQFATTFPIVKPQQVKQDPEQFVPGGQTDGSIKLYSSGTTGTKKTFYHPGKETVNESGLSVWGKLIQKAQAPLVLYGKWGGIDAVVALQTTRRIRPDVGVYEFSQTEDALDAILAHDVILLEIGVMSYKTFHHQLLELIKETPGLKSELSGKIFLLDLNSEPVTATELTRWQTALIEIFQTHAYITVAYAQNDTGLIGLYDHEARKTEADVQYKVTNNRLVEVLDEHSQLVFRKEGDIIITTFREDGSIFWRYDSGDRGVLSVDENGELYLSNIHRKEESGEISLWGSKVSITEFRDDVAKVVTAPFQLEVTSAYNRDHTKLNVTFKFYLPRNEETEKLIKQTFWQKIEEIIHANNEVAMMNEDTALHIDVDLTFSDSVPNFEKSWRINRES